MTRILILVMLSLSTTAWGFGSPKLKISAGALTGVYFPIASSIAKMVERRKGYETAVMPSSGSIDNIQRLMRGEVELALAAADNLYAAYNQLPPFQNLPAGKTLRVITSIYPELLHLVVHKKCIKSTQKVLMPGVLRRCVFNMGPPNSGTLEHTRMILDEMLHDPKGYTLYDFETATEKILSGELDGGFFTVGRQSLIITTLMNSGDFELLSLPPSVIKKIHLKFPYFSKHTLAAKTYQNQPRPTHTLAVYAQLATTNALTESLGRETIEILVAEIHELRAAHVCGRDFSLQTALEGVNIPVHAGARTFYIEQGVISPLLTPP